MAGRPRTAAGLLLALITAGGAAPALASQGPELSQAQRQRLDQAFALCLAKQKGPYTQNYCVCRDGSRQEVMRPDGRIVSPCGGAVRFCAAFRNEWSEALAQEGMYVANLFARDLHLWDTFPDHHDLVRGYVLEKFFVETNPDQKLSLLRSYGGLAGAEYEARDAPRFFERYLALPSFREPRHYLLAYELQRRYFVRNDQGQIHRARSLASAIQSQRPEFKPLRDAVHNQISAALVPRLAAYRDGLPAGGPRDRVAELIAEIEALTALDASALEAQIGELAGAGLRAELRARVPPPDAPAPAAIRSLAALMAFARRAVEAREVPPAEARRLIDLAITAAALIQRRGTELLEKGEQLSVREHGELLVALVEAAYGAGLLVERERAAATRNLDALLSAPDAVRAEFAQRLRDAERVVEWSQAGTRYAFEEAMPAWTYLLPQTNLFGDDVLRGSPLLLYAELLRRLQDHVAGGEAIRHEIFGAPLRREVRALNSGLAVGTLRVAPTPGSYQRREIVALRETPSDLQPAAGILTQGEGNVVSHVQLLARALGIPNAVLAPGVFELLAPHAGRRVFLIATPRGRVVLKDESAMTDADRRVVAEYTRNRERGADGSLGAGSRKLHIDPGRLELGLRTAIDLAAVRRADSGVRTGPKAAYLGELEHLLPDHVARGVVVPFGAYWDHFQRAPVAVPPQLRGRVLAEPGEPLPAFVERSYREFFGEMIPAGVAEEELSEWIRPRLEIVRASIEAAPLAPDLRASIRAELARQGLLRPEDPSQTVGLFVRSDTNVEDLDEFNGAGLNLTLFNLRSLEDVYAGIAQVWASPFGFRSFSWRQTLIDAPFWVLPSVVILESVPSEKSGVLVTADLERGDPRAMLIATSEGVGGAVDGSPAETLLWSPEGVELVTMFKSPWRRVLEPGGGSRIVASTRRELVLEPAELEALVAAAQSIRDRLAPSIDAAGRARPWDIEYGFASGKLWLFQVRPFVGNDELANVSALAVYEGAGDGTSAPVSLEERVP